MDYAMLKSLMVGGENADVRLYGFDEMGDLDLRDEMTGKTTVLVDAALKSLDATSLYGVHFILDEMERFAVVSFHEGMLADVADCTLHMSEEDGLGELKVYRINGVNVGIAVDDDVDSDTVWLRLSEKADAILSITKNFDNERNNRVRSLHEKYSVPAVVCCANRLYAFGAFLSRESGKRGELS